MPAHATASSPAPLSARSDVVKLVREGSRLGGLDLNDASVSDTLSLIERGTRLQRITAGLPTDLTRRYTESDLMRLAEWARESAYEVAELGLTGDEAKRSFVYRFRAKLAGGA
jgi:hypothetical protein